MLEISENDHLALNTIGILILEKEEDHLTKSSVTLKKLSSGYILNVQCETKNLAKSFFSEDFKTINQSCQNYLVTLREKGNPFLDMGMSKEQLKGMASQLGKPDGEYGVKVGNMMNETNISMTRKSLEQLSLKDRDEVLELGHGNANHLLELFSLAKDLNYFGLDISELMKDEAEKYSLENNLNQTTKFQLYDGTNIPFDDNSFDKIFTVNTIYFWQNPKELMKELARVLKPNGVICITFNDEVTMKQMPFVEYGFKIYNQNLFLELVDGCSLNEKKSFLHTEIIKSNLIGEMQRTFWVMTLSKD